MRNKWLSAAASVVFSLAATLVLAQQPELLPAPKLVQPASGAPSNASSGQPVQPAPGVTSKAASGQPVQPPTVPGFEQLQKFLFPQPVSPTTKSDLKGARALYRKTLELWKDNALIFMNKETSYVDSSRADAWLEKWDKRGTEIKNDKDYTTADLLALLALDDLGERFNYYLTPEEVEAENKQQDPTSVGIGARVELEGTDELVSALPKTASEEDFEKALVVGPKHRLILTPIKGSPAEQAGMLKGDVLKKVDGEDVDGKTLRDVLKLIKGKSGSMLELVLSRQNKEGKDETVKLNITRQPFTHPVVHQDALEDNIIYLKLDHFSADHTQDEMEAALRDVAKLKLEKKLPVKLILDLRSNPGGRLDFAVNIVGFMLPEGNIVTLKERKDSNLQVTRWTATRDALIYSYPAPASPNSMVSISAQKRVLILPEDVPVVILVNHRSASASELTSRALQYYKRAVVVGESTYGKGVGQQVYQLPDNRRAKVIKFTFCPGDQDIDWQGVHPNDGYELKWQKPAKKGDDNQLDLAKKAVLAEYERIEKEKASSNARRDAAVNKNKEEFEKKRAQRQEELKRQASEREEELKKKANSGSQPGSQPSSKPGSQPGSQPGGKPGAKPDPRGSQPTPVPAPASKSPTPPPIMPPAPDDDDDGQS